ncbi:unnamed protein product [Didymodactylos carnosus]|uniref:Uncharacterized protein n=1 Tax=Didymodactylos carnosus TaxID=1234261 RepID=A0A814ITR4_9BILA|nr:unnamed protein product [Didymodactylos carnosus]CAF3798911.1 unnamed protein product [Didymodactylos carnosus]
MTAESKADANVGSCPTYAGLASQHLLFAELVSNRGGFISHREETISKSECARYAAHKRRSVTDLRTLSTGFALPRHRGDNYNHHPFCPSFCGQRSPRSAISKQYAVNQAKRGVPPSGALKEEKLEASFPSSIIIKEEKTKSRIPVRTFEATSPSCTITTATSSNSSSPSVINERVSSSNKKTMIPRLIPTRFLPSTNHTAAVVDLSKIKNKAMTSFLNVAQTNNDANPLQDIMEQQAELKAYYDSFPNIDDATNQTDLDIKKAEEFTDSILHHLPSGDVNDRETLLHVLNNLLTNKNQQCLFYDSAKGINLHDASGNLADINFHDRPFVLKLKSSKGLGKDKIEKDEYDDLKLIQTLNNVIEQKKFHPIIEDILERLSKAHDIEKKYIAIKRVYIGTFNVVYTVMDLVRHVLESIQDASLKLRIQFEEFVSARIHPLLYRPSFDISYFDDRGNKTFSNESEIHEVGPPGHTKLYTSPTEWTRYGLKVLSKYPTDDWLHPFQGPGNWYRAFHGTGRADAKDFGNYNQPLDKQYACVDALSSIFVNDFCKARVHAFGEGVYCSPNPKFLENRYVGTVPLDTRQGKKNFKCMLQVAVNPDGVNCVKDDTWVVANPKDIRPYGILIKEV